MTFFIDLLTAGIVMGSLYGIIGIGFTLLYKSTKTLNLAHGDLIMFLAFVCYGFSIQAGLPFGLAVLITSGCAFLMGLLIELVFLRPLVGQPLLSVIMMTLGLSSLLHALSLMLWGPLPHSYPQYFKDIPLHVAELSISRFNIGVVIVMLLVVLLFGLFFKFTGLGLAMRATADDQITARSLGTRASRIFAIAWGLSCMTAALGGIIFGTMYGIDYMMGMMGMKAFPGVILGGLDSIFGAVAGGLIVGITESLAGGYLDRYMVGIRDLLPYLILLVVLMIRPYGLFGSKKIERV